MITYWPWPTLLAVGLMTRFPVAVRPVPTFNSFAIVNGFEVIVLPLGVKGTPAIEVVLSIVAALATPAVRAVTAAAAIRIFFIDIWLIPLEVL